MRKKELNKRWYNQHKGYYKSEQMIKKRKEYDNKHKKEKKEYEKRNKIKITKRQKRYKRKNKAKILRYEREYYKENPEKQRARNLRRYARMKNIIHDFSTKEWLDKLAKTRGFCPKCKKYVGIWNLTLDHIKPVSKAKNGWVYTIDDVQPLCRNCNSKKKDKIE